MKTLKENQKSEIVCFALDIIYLIIYYRLNKLIGGEHMSNMRSYSLAFYPETKKKLEAIKDSKDLTWDELLNYLMEVKEDETKDERKINQK